MTCHLEFTDNRFVYAKKSYPDIPLLVNSEHQFVLPVCEYLRGLVISEQLQTSTAKTYAQCLLLFWNYLETAGRKFEEVCDEDLIEWMNTQESRGVSSSTRRYRCDVVFEFNVWMQINGHVEHAVQLPDEYITNKFPVRLTSKLVKEGSKAYRRSKYKIISAVRPRVRGSSFQHTPNAEEVTKIYVAAQNDNNPDLMERNHLLISWYLHVGLRRKEWIFLSLDQIPTWEDIYKLQRNREAHELKLTRTKYDRFRFVGVIPELLERTREYIEGARAEIVARFKSKNGSKYKEPNEIFLSNKTGLALSFNATTNLLRSWFKRADVDGHGHRLRATYLTNLIEAEIVAEELLIRTHPETKIRIDYELILRKVAERAGHVDIASLRSYVTFVRKRRAREPGQPDPVTLQQQLLALEQTNAQLKLRLKKQESLIAEMTHDASTSSAIAKAGGTDDVEGATECSDTDEAVVAIPELVILCGIPASGKTTLYKAKFAGTHEHISLDRTRSQSRALELKNFLESIEQRKSIVIDNTNVTRALRMRYIQPALLAGYRIVGIQLNISLDEALRRNSLRDRTVPESAVKKFARQFEALSTDEGFDRIDLSREPPLAQIHRHKEVTTIPAREGLAPFG